MKRASLVLLLLAGCAYDPPMRTDHASAKYRQDLAQCQVVAAREADRIVRTKGYLFVSYPLSYPLEERAQTRVCLQGRGYAG